MPDNLALRMRPKTIDQVIGQEHLVGPGKIIRRMVEANRLSSMIQKQKIQRAADKNHMERNKAAEGSFNMVSDHRSVWSDLLLSASWRLADGFSEL